MGISKGFSLYNYFIVKKLPALLQGFKYNGTYIIMLFVH